MSERELTRKRLANPTNLFPSSTPHSFVVPSQQHHNDNPHITIISTTAAMAALEIYYSYSWAELTTCSSSLQPLLHSPYRVISKQATQLTILLSSSKHKAHAYTAPYAYIHLYIKVLMCCIMGQALYRRNSDLFRADIHHGLFSSSSPHLSKAA